MDSLKCVCAPRWMQVLDLWVDSFNPEFIERSMAGVIRDLMLALWAHIQPHPSPHGTKASAVVGRLLICLALAAVRTFSRGLLCVEHLHGMLCACISSTCLHGMQSICSCHVRFSCRWLKSWASWADAPGSGCWMA